jgi:hypothetical protein
LLNIYINKFGETVLVKAENKIMNKVEPIADNGKGKPVREFCLFEEVALSATVLDFSNLTSMSGGLDIFEMNLWILPKGEYLVHYHSCHECTHKCTQTGCKVPFWEDMGK